MSNSDDLDFTNTEALKALDAGLRKSDPVYRCPYSRSYCRLVRTALYFSITLAVLLTVVLSFGLVKTVRLFLSLT